MARPRVTWRPVAVLALLLGVLAMHAVGGAGHEAEHASPRSGPAGHAMAGADPMGAGQAGPGSTADVPATGSGAMVMALCLAVLVGGVLLLGRLPARAPLPVDPHRPPGARVSTARRGRGPPRLLLAELCVLRT